MLFIFVRAAAIFTVNSNETASKKALVKEYCCSGHINESASFEETWDPTCSHAIIVEKRNIRLQGSKLAKYFLALFGSCLLDKSQNVDVDNPVVNWELNGSWTGEGKKIYQHLVVLISILSHFSNQKKGQLGSFLSWPNGTLFYGYFVGVFMIMESFLLQRGMNKRNLDNVALLPGHIAQNHPCEKGCTGVQGRS